MQTCFSSYPVKTQLWTREAFLQFSHLMKHLNHPNFYIITTLNMLFRKDPLRCSDAHRWIFIVFLPHPQHHPLVPRPWISLSSSKETSCILSASNKKPGACELYMISPREIKASVTTCRDMWTGAYTQQWGALLRPPTKMSIVVPLATDWTTEAHFHCLLFFLPVFTFSS